MVKGRCGLAWVPNSFQAATLVTGVPSGYLAVLKNPTSRLRTVAWLGRLWRGWL